MNQYKVKLFAMDEHAEHANWQMQEYLIVADGEFAALVIAGALLRAEWDCVPKVRRVSVRPGYQIDRQLARN